MSNYEKLVLKLLLMLVRHAFGFHGVYDADEKATIMEAQKAIKEVE